MPPEQLDEVKGHRRRRQGRPAIDSNLPRRRVELDLGDEDKAGFARGDNASYTDRHLQTLIGVITRSHPKTAGIDTSDASWSV